MKYVLHILFVLLSFGPMSMYGYSQYALEHFAKTGDGRGADLRGADLAPIIQKLQQERKIRFALELLLRTFTEEYPFISIDLREAALEGASFRDTNMTYIRLEGATFDSKTDFTNAIFARGSCVIPQLALIKDSPTFFQAILTSATFQDQQLINQLGVCNCPKNQRGLLHYWECSDIQQFIKDTGANVTHFPK